MKNLLSLILLALLAFACGGEADAQDISRNGSVGKSFGYYTGRVTDSVSANQDTLEVTFKIGPDQAVLWDLDVHLALGTAFTANDSAKVEIFGKPFASRDWTSIGTAQYYDAAGDTPLSFTEQTTADFIRYIMVRVTHIGTAGNVTLRSANSNGKDIELKGWF